jgi:hypothetical protein
MADDREPVSAKLEPVPDSTEILGQEHERRKKRLIIGFAAAGVAIVVGTGVALVVQDRAAKSRLQSSAADLSVCLFGDAVPAGSAVAKQLRGAQLTAMSLPDGERAVHDGQPWPQRCGVVAQALMESAKDAGLSDKGDDADLVDRADALAKQLKTPTAQFADLSAAADGTWSALEKAKVVVEPSKRVPGPPPRSKPLSPAELGDTSAISKTPFVFGSVVLSSYRGETFHILVQDAGVPKAPFLCAFDDGPIRCRSVPGELGQGKLALTIFGSTEKGAWPLLLAGEGGQGGLYRSEDGVKIADGPLLGASIAKDGIIRVLRQKGAQVQLEETHPGLAKAKLTKYSLPDGCTTMSVGMLWDEPVVECRIPFDRSERRGEQLFLPLGKELPGFKKADATAEEAADGDEEARPSEPPPISGGAYATCRAGDTRVVGRGSALFFKDALGWSRPPKSNMRGGQVSCTDKVATVTYLADARGETPWRSSITHTRCTVAECTATNMQFENLLKGGLEGAPREKLFDATSAGDAMIVAWASGLTGGVRLRIGAADGIVAAPDVVVYDDLANEGPLAGKPDLTDMTVIGQPKQATILLRSSRGVHALRIASDGGFFPAEVVWEGETK